MYYKLNNLSGLSGAALVQTIAGIPPGVTTLDLGCNELHRKTGAELAQMFGGIPASVASLDLSGNELQYISAVDLEIAFAGIPATVIALNLSYNELNFKTAAELAEIFASIPASVASLNLSGNRFFCNFTAAELVEAFRGIPASVTALDLSDNEFTCATNDDLVAVFNALPPTIHEITLSLEDLNNQTEEQLFELGRALPHVMTINVMDDGGKPVENLKVASLRKFAGTTIIGQVLKALDADEIGIPSEVACLVVSHATGTELEDIASRFNLLPDQLAGVESPGLPEGAEGPMLPVAAVSAGIAGAGIAGAGLTSHSIFRRGREEQKELEEEHKGTKRARI